MGVKQGFDDLTARERTVEVCQGTGFVSFILCVLCPLTSAKLEM